MAETLDEFRGRYRYNLLDDNVRRFGAEVPQIWLWDDHEAVNNWSPSKDLSGDERYIEKSVPLLVARGRRAFLEYAPIRRYAGDEGGRIYRHVPYGELLDLFVLDMRSYRGPNTWNRQSAPSGVTAFLGRAQCAWLKQSLHRSRATWKVIAADMPLGLQVKDGTDDDGRPRFENAANGDGPVLGREFELADLLQFVREQEIANIVGITADVHYCAAHRYDPALARCTDFKPFWEFVAGPLNAGSFGPAALDDTFGPQVVFQKVLRMQNASPFAGHQFFGQIDIYAASGAMTVRLKDIDGGTLLRRSWWRSEGSATGLPSSVAHSRLRRAARRRRRSVQSLCPYFSVYTRRSRTTVRSICRRVRNIPKGCETNAVSPALRDQPISVNSRVERRCQVQPGSRWEWVEPAFAALSKKCRRKRHILPDRASAGRPEGSRHSETRLRIVLHDCSSMLAGEVEQVSGSWQGHGHGGQEWV